MTPIGGPRETVQRMFAAFRAGDLDGLVETVHPESSWTYYGANPRLAAARFTGRDAVRRFFERILRRLEVTTFDDDRYLVDGDTVAVFGGADRAR